MKFALCPYNNFDLSGCANWLTQQAENGLYMKYFYWPVVLFVEDTPSKTRYHIEPPADNQEFGSEQTQDEIFSACGWEYLCSMDYGKLYRSTDPSAVEPYTDADSKAQSLRSLEYDFKHLSIFRLVYVLIVCAAIFISIGSNDPIYFRSLIILVLCAPWLIWSYIRERTAWKLVKEMRAQLLDGALPPLSKPRNPFWEITYNALNTVILCIVLACCLTI